MFHDQSSPENDILFVVFNLEIGGAEWVIVNLCNSLADAGLSVTLLTNKEAPLCQEISSAVQVVYLSNNSRIHSYLRAFVKINHCLRRNRFRVIMTTQRNVSCLVCLAHWLCRSSAMMVVRAAASNVGASVAGMSKMKAFIRKQLMRWSYRHADLIVANSPGTRDAVLRNRLVGKSACVATLRNPLNIRLIQQRACEESTIAVKDGCKHLVAIGRLTAQKQFDDLICATERLIERGEKVQVSILGEGPLRSKLEDMIVNKGLSDFIQLVGKVPNPYPTLKTADVFVLTSKFEGFGMVVVEALALGVPVVATDIPDGPRWILSDGKFGALYPVGDVEQLVECISAVFRKRPLGEPLVERAWHYDRAAVARDFMKEFELVPLHSKPSP